MPDDCTTEAIDSLRAIDGALRPVGSHCTTCEVVRFPVREYCPSCMSRTEKRILDADAELETYSVIHVSSPGVRTPYAAGFVRFTSEGIRAFTPLVGDTEAFEVGMALAPTVTAVGETAKTWAFKPVEEVH